MKTRIKHLFGASAVYWTLQLVVMFSGYTGGDVILRVYLPIFAVSAVFLLVGQYWVGHGVWLFSAAGLLAEWLMRGSGGRTNAMGIIANITISLLGWGLCVAVQLLANKRKAKKAAQNES